MLHVESIQHVARSLQSFGEPSLGFLERLFGLLALRDIPGDPDDPFALVGVGGGDRSGKPASVPGRQNNLVVDALHLPTVHGGIDDSLAGLGDFGGQDLVNRAAEQLVGRGREQFRPGCEDVQVSALSREDEDHVRRRGKDRPESLFAAPKLPFGLASLTDFFTQFPGGFLEVTCPLLDQFLQAVPMILELGFRASALRDVFEDRQNGRSVVPCQRGSRQQQINYLAVGASGNGIDVADGLFLLHSLNQLHQPLGVHGEARCAASDQVEGGLSQHGRCALVGVQNGPAGVGHDHTGRRRLEEDAVSVFRLFQPGIRLASGDDLAQLGDDGLERLARFVRELVGASGGKVQTRPGSASIDKRQDRHRPKAIMQRHSADLFRHFGVGCVNRLTSLHEFDLRAVGREGPHRSGKLAGQPGVASKLQAVIVACDIHPGRINALDAHRRVRNGLQRFVQAGEARQFDGQVALNLQEVFQLLARGDVGDDPDQACWFAVGVGEDGLVEHDVADAPVDALQTVLVALRGSLLQQLPVHAAISIGLPGVPHFLQCASDHLLPGDAHVVGKGLVAAEVDQVGVLIEHGVGNCIQQLLEQRRMVPQQPTDLFGRGLAAVGLVVLFRPIGHVTFPVWNPQGRGRQDRPGKGSLSLSRAVRKTLLVGSVLRGGPETFHPFA